MWGSKKSTYSVAGGTTLISSDTVVVGDLHFSGNLDVEGLVQGNILARTEKDALVRVVDKGRVEGEIRSPSVIVNGCVEGDIHSSRHLELAPLGRVNGNVFYTQLEMAAGSEVNGSLTPISEYAAGQVGTPDAAVEVLHTPEKPGPTGLVSAKVD